MKREEKVVWSVTAIAGVLAGVILASHVHDLQLREAMPSGWWKALLIIANKVGFTFWVFCPLLLLLPWGLLSRNRVVLNTLCTLAVFCGTLGTVVGASNALAALSSDSVQEVFKECIPSLVSVFMSTAAGIVVAGSTYLSAMFAKINLFDGEQA